MSFPTYGSRWKLYAQQWDAMTLTRPSMAQEAAERIIANKARYNAVALKTGVPWWWIGCTHYREADLDFTTQLAQGDPLGQVSRNVPAGLGPYYGADAWERAAIEGLEHDAVQRVIDWRLEKALWWWEKWNGEGYYNHGVPSAYVWAGTTIDKGGMYVRDHVWDSTKKDPRVGCAAILKCLHEMDISVLLVRETDDAVPSLPPAPTIPEKPEPMPVPTPAPTPVPAPQTPQLDPAVQAAIAQAVAAAVPAVVKALKSSGALSTMLSGVVAALPQLGVWGLVASALLNAFGVLGSAPMAGAENASAVTAFATTGGALLSGLLSRLAPKDPAK